MSFSLPAKLFIRRFLHSKYTCAYIATLKPIISGLEGWLVKKSTYSYLAYKITLKEIAHNIKIEIKTYLSGTLKKLDEAFFGNFGF